MSDNRNRQQWLNHSWISYIFLVLLAGVAVFYSSSQFLAHSELWAVTYSKLALNTGYQAYATYYKPLFYLVLKPLHLFSLSNSSHILAARTLFSFIGLANLVLFFLISKKIYQSKEIALLMAIFLITMPAYTNQFFRVRSDVLALFFALAALYTLIRWPKLEKPSQKLIVALLVACCFLSTPKAIYLVFSLAAYYFAITATGKTQGVSKAMIGTMVIFFFAVVVVILLSLFFSQSAPYQSAMVYFISGFEDYFNSSQWMHIFELFKRSPLHMLCLLGAFVYGWVKVLRDGWKPSSSILVLSSLVLIFMLVHNEKWPFFIGNFLLLVVLPVGGLFQVLWRLKWGKVVPVVLILCPLLTTVWGHWYMSNKIQFMTIRYLEQIIAELGDPLVMDGVGILPRQRNTYTFISRNDLASQEGAVRILKFVQPDLVLMTTKMNQIKPRIISNLIGSYTSLGLDIWVNMKHKMPFKEQINPQNLLLEEVFPYELRPLHKPLISL